MSHHNTEHGERAAMIERHLAGEPLAQIAAELHLSRYTVRKWWRRYREQGWPGICVQAPGPPARGALRDCAPLVKYVALRLKRQNPGWGLDMLLLHMRRRASLQGLKLPKRTALWAYLHHFQPRLLAQRRLRTQRPPSAAAAVAAVHQRWQMDFKGEVFVPGVGWVKAWQVCDEYSHAPLACQLYCATQPGAAQAGTMRDVQVALRRTFARWGLPDALLLDRDPHWIGSSRLEWPGALLLWLVGLGVLPLITRRHCPTDNAHIERQNRTWHEHVGLSAQGHSLAELQELSERDQADRRSVLPSRNPHCAGRPPLQALPELDQPRRPYTPDQEAACFSLPRVYAYLAQWEWQRKVDRDGSISLADFNRRISAALAGQVVKVRFDADTAEFVACSLAGEELRRFTLPIISAQHICGCTPGGT